MAYIVKPRFYLKDARVSRSKVIKKRHVEIILHLGDLPRKNVDVMAEAMEEANDEAKKIKKKEKKKKKRKLAEENGDGESMDVRLDNSSS